MFAITLLAVLLVTTVTVDAEARSSSSVIYDNYDIVKGKEVTVDCTETCSVYASATGDTPYEQRILLTKPNEETGQYDTLQTLQSLSFTGFNGMKKQLRVTGTLVIINNNTDVDPTRPYYIFCVYDSKTANHDFDVYEVSAGVKFVTEEGITLMTPASDVANRFFTLSSFNIASATGISVYPGGYDYDHDHRNALLSVSGQDAATFTIFPIMTPVVTVVANDKAKADVFTFSVDIIAGRTWDVRSSGTFAFYSPGYSIGNVSLRSVVPTGKRYIFDFDATATIDYSVTYAIGGQDHCDLFVNDAMDPLTKYTQGSGGENVTGVRNVNKLQFECDWISNAGSLFQMVVTSAGAV